MYIYMLYERLGLDRAEHRAEHDLKKRKKKHTQGEIDV